MQQRVEGKVALITGAARGQGRSHAIRLAEEGADIIAVDMCGPIESIPYDLATSDDLMETKAAVEALGRRIVTAEADVRDLAGMTRAVDDAVSQLGRIDIVCANAGICSLDELSEMSEQMWQDMIDVNLTGVWKTCRAATPHLNDGGSIVITSSAAAAKAPANLGHYVAAKTGVLGMMRTMAIELGPRRIRVNSVLPSQVPTGMILNDMIYGKFCPDLENPTIEDFKPRSAAMHVMDMPWAELQDVSNAVLFLACDESRCITGLEMTVDLGFSLK
jgi:(+)-trans-carveol dehydrogenase